MITTLRLKFGHSPASEPETINVTPITVFVGPNNSGKSKVLQELHHRCLHGSADARDVILDQVTFSTMTERDADQEISALTLKPNPGEALPAGSIVVGSRGERIHTQPDRLRQVLLKPPANIAAFCQWFLKFRTLLLDGKGRMNLVEPIPAGDLQLAPHRSLQVLFRDDGKRHEVRRIIREAFDSFFVIDPTNLGHLRIRLAARPPASDVEELGIHEAAVQFHSAAQVIQEASDGVKAFTGIVIEVLAGDPKVVLIDEPEAFLHPSLSNKLGNELARAAVSSEKRVFVSTHSPSFVMGCIQSGAPVNIIRLTYRSGTATARVLPSTEILQLMRNPLLRSTGVLGGLFYEFVVVTESDADRAFYQEVNERLLRWRPEWGIPNCLFLNAQNKQTIHTIIRPLRKLGIPAAAIAEVDVLKEGGTAWSNILSGAYVPKITLEALAVQRQAVKSAIDKTGRDMKRHGGVTVLSGSEREAAKNVFEQLAEYGVFVVPGGELESWLTHLGASGHGPSWLVGIFEKMGDDPDLEAYVKPASGDVWEFIGRVKEWLVDPARKGIPV